MTPPRGMQALEHVEGLTLVFRENHHLRRRGVRWATFGVVSATAATLVLAGLALLAVPLLAYVGLAELVLLVLVLLFSVGLTVGPSVLAVAGGALGLLVVHDAGRTQVRLTVGVRGITVERKSEGERTTFPATEELRVTHLTEGPFPVLRLEDDTRRVDIPVLADASAVDWLVDQVKARCAGTGTRTAVPLPLAERVLA